MSIQRVHQFFERSLHESFLQEQLDKTNWVAEQIIELASRVGYSFTKEDLLAYLLEQHNSEQMPSATTKKSGSKASSLS